MKKIFINQKYFLVVLNYTIEKISFDNNKFLVNDRLLDIKEFSNLNMTYIGKLLDLKSDLLNEVLNDLNKLRNEKGIEKYPVIDFTKTLVFKI